MISAVHTTGINLESLLAIVASITAIILGVGGLVVKLVRGPVRDLLPRLGKIETHLEKQDDDHDEISKRLSGVSDRVARLEGPFRNRH